jgi:glycosyltransferase involved in cell wall biosynthesis
MKPVLFVTGHAPPDRVGAFARLHERENVEFALFGGRLLHATPAATELPFPHAHLQQRELLRLASGGSHRAVVCSSGGRLALPLSWAGARRAQVPLILWTSLWAHPRSAVHALSFVAMRRLYRSADAIVTYGPHVSAYVSARGARNVYVAPQSVDNQFWGERAEEVAEGPSWPRGSETRFLFVGWPARVKGLQVLLQAWRRLAMPPDRAALMLVGVDPDPALQTAGVSWAGRLAAPALRNFYGAADVLVVPSIPTRTSRETWGLVVNEAFNQHLPVIASDAVGAAAGGLVRDGANGLVVPAGNASALAEAIRRLATDPELRTRMGDRAALDVRAYSHDAWAEGFSRALASLGLSLRPAADAGRAGSVA